MAVNDIDGKKNHKDSNYFTGRHLFMKIENTDQGGDNRFKCSNNCSSAGFCKRETLRIAEIRYNAGNDTKEGNPGESLRAVHQSKGFFYRYKRQTCNPSYNKGI